MKKLWSKIKQIKHWEFYAAGLAVVVMIAIYFSTFGSSNKKVTTTTNPTTTTVTTAQTYATALENKLQSVLSNVAGAGKVAVLVMTDGEGTAELAYDTQEKTVTQAGTNGQTITTTTKDHQMITTNGQPVILWTNPPQIVGIVIVATGANDVRVRLNLLRAVQTIIGDKTVAIEILSGT